MFDCKRCGFPHGNAHPEDTPESCIRLLKDLLRSHDDSLQLLIIAATAGDLSQVCSILRRRFSALWGREAEVNEILRRSNIR